jgi:hypothetical protein
MIFIIIIISLVLIFIVYANKKYSNSTQIHSESTTRNKILNSKSENNPAQIFIANNRYAADDSKLTGSFNIAIKGLYYRNSEEKRRAKNIDIFEELFLEKEFGNRQDDFAVKVITWDGYFIGYVDIVYSQKITRMIDTGYKINCFLSKSSHNEIPYQYMDIYYLGKNPKYKLPKSNNIIYVDYKQKIDKLKENIKNSQVSADKAKRDTIRENALKRVQQYQIELAKLEKIKEDNENN